MPQLIQDPDADVRTRVLEALEDRCIGLEGLRFVHLLTDILQDTDERVRARGIQTLATVMMRHPDHTDEGTRAVKSERSKAMVDPSVKVRESSLSVCACIFDRIDRIKWSRQERKLPSRMMIEFKSCLITID